MELMKKHTLNIYLPLFAIFLAVVATPAWAQSELSIQDTSGFTRAVADVGEAGKVEFNLVDAQSLPADNIEVTLTNAATTEVVTAQSVNGVAVFENLGPGVWTVSTTTPGIVFTNVAVVPASSLLVAGTVLSQLGPPLLGAGAIAGGTIALVEVTDGDPVISPAS